MLDSETGKCLRKTEYFALEELSLLEHQRARGINKPDEILAALKAKPVVAFVENDKLVKRSGLTDPESELSEAGLHVAEQSSRVHARVLSDPNIMMRQGGGGGYRARPKSEGRFKSTWQDDERSVFVEPAMKASSARFARSRKKVAHIHAALTQAITRCVILDCTTRRERLQRRDLNREAARANENILRPWLYQYVKDVLRVFVERAGRQCGPDEHNLVLLPNLEGPLRIDGKTFDPQLLIDLLKRFPDPPDFAFCLIDKPNKTVSAHMHSTLKYVLQTSVLGFGIESQVCSP